MQTGFLLVIFFFVSAIVLTTIGIGFRYLEAERRKRVSAVLKTAATETVQAQETTILMDAANEPGIMQVVSDLPVMRSLERKIQQAGLGWSAPGVVAAMAVFGCIGVLLGLRVNVPIFREFAIVVLTTMMGSLPYGYVLFRRNKRMGAFEEQFPEALDFLARSMRAGHAFSVSLEMMSDESPDPLGIEFRQVFNEQNLGAPIDVALRNLADRIPLVDVNFFVSAVVMQRDTGGNLAEILTKLSYVIRERFRLKGQVKAVSAHGRITAMILSVLPIVTMLALMVVAPGYLAGMAEDTDGRYLIIGAIAGQILGYAWMKKIIKIKV
jgi:tight adherence protein B